LKSLNNLKTGQLAQQSSTASILARLARLEKALHLEEPVEIDTRDVRRTLDLICERRRAQAGWKPSDVGLAEVIAQARAAERAHALR
jgi:nucleoside-diphosphate-sugar epimerase